MPLHRVAELAELHEDRGIEVKLGEKNIVLIRVGNEVRAFQGDCPHAGAPLADGAVCNGQLICPWHKAQFAVDDGRLCEPPALDALLQYPAHVVDGHVQVDDQPIARPTPTLEKDARCFVIIGAGAAGTAAAAALREKGFNGQVLLIDREEHPGYDRTALSKAVLAAEMPPEQTPDLREEHFYTEHRIERIWGEVMKLDVTNRRLFIADGRRFDYDAALITTGGEPRALPLIGAQLPQVLTLRHRDDARHILDAARPGTHVLIVGDSFIGLEAASALRKNQVEVTVLARHETPFAAPFGERIGRAIRALHEEHGVVFRTHVEVSRFEGDTAGSALAHAVLSSGEKMPVDLALIGIGVDPATQFIDGVTLEKDGSLKVDGAMRVTDNVWAAGDIATFPLADSPVRIEHWRVAQQQARIAASNMLGADERYTDVPYFWTLHFDKRVDYLGHADKWDDIVYLGEPETFEFLALMCRQGVVVAAVACKREREMAMLAERMKQPLFVNEALMLITAMAS
ncbi:FAD-dependent oxidoreductase [Pseudomonas huanghezhanensis]|uniref:FAD-dependent oxidoreductase n=1 Tax=Pseudomonas huanghezhanensis TaxID=3002903 RepID=UPI0022868D68|nr:FAD-dependent oxidoreductase [Pseudomonas sp. BSw22131]